MERTDTERRLIDMLASRTGTDSADWYLVFKARFGMQVAFEGIRAACGEGSVATQLLTCCTAVNPILAGGLVPVYAEISRRTASMDPDWLLDCPTDVRAVVLQHTYGIVDNESSALLVDRAHGMGAVVVEDCAHGIARMARDAEGRPIADISVHSFGVEKMLDCQFGGAVWINPASPHAEVVSRVREALSALPVITGRIDALTRCYLFENRVLVHCPRPLARWLRRVLPSLGLFEPPVSEVERAGGMFHRPACPSEQVCGRMLRALEDLDDRQDQHRRACAIYRSALAHVRGLGLLDAALYGEVQPLLRFPVLARDTATADRIIEEVCAAGCYTTAWYRPELGPGVTDGAAYLVPSDRSGLSTCDHMVSCVATLPCDIDEERARMVAEVVRRVVSS